MSRFVFSATMSLDGFVAGPGGDMGWLSEHVEVPGLDLDAVVRDIGALLIGRRTWGGDDPNRDTDAEGPFGGRWHGTSVVLTHDPPDEDPGPDTVFATDLESALDLARDSAADRDVHVLGADVARQCLLAGALDEVLVYVAPVLLGDGTRLLDEPGGALTQLAPLDPGPWGPAAMRFRVLR